MVTLLLWITFLSYYSLGSLPDNEHNEDRVGRKVSGENYTPNNKVMFDRMVRSYNQEILDLSSKKLFNVLHCPPEPPIKFSFQIAVKECFKELFEPQNSEVFEKRFRVVRKAVDNYLVNAANYYSKMPIYRYVMPEGEIGMKTVFLFKFLLDLSSFEFKEKRLEDIFRKCKATCFDPSNPLTEEFISLLYQTDGEEYDEKKRIRKTLQEFQVKLIEIDLQEARLLYYLLEKHYFLRAIYPLSKEFSTMLDVIDKYHPEKFHKVARKFNSLILKSKPSDRYKKFVITQSLISKHNNKVHNRASEAKSSNYKWMNSIILERTFYLNLAIYYLMGKVPEEVFSKVNEATENLVDLVWCLKSMPRARQSTINTAYLELLEECSNHKEYQEHLEQFKKLIHNYSPVIGKQAKLIYEQNKKILEIKSIMMTSKDGKAIGAIFEKINREDSPSLEDSKKFNIFMDLKEGLKIFDLSLDTDYLTMCETWVLPMIKRNLYIMQAEKFNKGVNASSTKYIDIERESKNYQEICNALEFVNSGEMPGLKTLAKEYLKNRSDPTHKTINEAIRAVFDIETITTTYKFEKEIEIQLPPLIISPFDEGAKRERKGGRVNRGRRGSNLKIGDRKSQKSKEPKKMEEVHEPGDRSDNEVILETPKIANSESTEIQPRNDMNEIRPIIPRRSFSQKDPEPSNSSNKILLESPLILPDKPVNRKSSKKSIPPLPLHLPKLPRRLPSSSRFKRTPITEKERSKSQGESQKVKKIAKKSSMNK